MSMTAQLKSRLVIAFAFMALAGSLRFYKLGSWPFAGDETYTLAEERSLFLQGGAPQDSPIYRVPRILPLSYLVHHLGNSLFGRDEFGSRVAPAVLGTLIVGIVFLMIDALQGRATAIATALLVALWPAHVFQSQQVRFYIIAAFFSCLCIFIGAFAAQRRSTPLCILLACLICASVLCHTLTVVLLPITFAGILAGAYADRRPLPRNVVYVFLVTTLAVSIFYGIYLRPLLMNWNKDATWAYGVLHSILASVNRVGWPVFLLGALGVLLLSCERTAQNWYWITCALGWAAATAILPLLIPYHPEYVFPLEISILVAAGYAVGIIYQGLCVRNRFIGYAWIAVACLGNLPGLASHYMDGSRGDMRTAAQYVQKNWRTGDRVAGPVLCVFAHYAQDCEPAIPLFSSEAVAQLNQLADGKGRIWVVLESNRSGLSEDIRQWLGTHCSHELHVRRLRFDYADHCVDVYLYTPEKRGHHH
jgi:hypothetical protein